VRQNLFLEVDSDIRVRNFYLDIASQQHVQTKRLKRFICIISQKEEDVR
jgi:hypothetical protein